MVLAIAATFIYVALLLALRGLVGEGGDVEKALGRITVLQALLNALLVPVAFGLVGWLQRLEPERI